MSLKLIFSRPLFLTKVPLPSPSSKCSHEPSVAHRSSYSDPYHQRRRNNYPCHSCRYCMTGKFSTTTTIPIGISGTVYTWSNCTSVPHPSWAPTLFQGKTTQAIELHCFLMIWPSCSLLIRARPCHLSNHTHFTGLDIDLMTNFFGSCVVSTMCKSHKIDLHTTSILPPSTSVGQCLPILWLPSTHHFFHRWKQSLLMLMITPDFRGHHETSKLSVSTQKLSIYLSHLP